MKCLEKDRTRRLRHRRGLRGATCSVTWTNEPVASPVRRPTMYRFQKLVRRNKLAFAAAGAVMAAMLLGLCIATVSLIRERRAYTLAVQARAAEEQHRKLAVEQQELAGTSGIEPNSTFMARTCCSCNKPWRKATAAALSGCCNATFQPM